MSPGLRNSGSDKGAPEGTAVRLCGYGPGGHGKDSRKTTKNNEYNRRGETAGERFPRVFAFIFRL